jgi:hypothetical protein
MAALSVYWHESQYGIYGNAKSSLPYYSGLMLASLTTLPHFSVSSTTILPNSEAIHRL